MHSILDNPDALLRQSDLLPTVDRATGRRTPGLIPVSATTLWRWCKAGEFPRPVRLSANAVAWRASDVAAWLRSRQSV